MKVTVWEGEIGKVDTEALIFLLFKQEKPYPEMRQIDKALEGGISEAIESRSFEAKQNQTYIHHVKGFPFKQVILGGLGEEEKFDLDKYRQASAAAAQQAQGLNKKRIAYHIRRIRDFEPVSLGRAAVEGAILGTYKFEKYKGEKEKKELSEIKIVTTEISSKERLKIEWSKIYSEAANYSRDIANTPANEATPSYLAERAKELAMEKGLEYEVLEKKDMVEKGMEGIIAVSKGSHELPKTIILRYRPKEAKARIGLVGKGITFDSGGISLKREEDMDKMKFDKTGACAVLGIFKAASEAGFPVELIGVIPCTENLPGGGATRPGDIIRPYKGKTVEVVNTDAEGRLILADALSYISEYKPEVVLDFATLTGACVVALGSIAMGMMGNEEELKDKIREMSSLSGEKIWELPLFEEYGNQIKSDVADLKNVGGRKAGAITGAMFLKNFIGKYKWVHLDIAGTSYDRENDEIPYYGKGATGTGVRLIAYLLENYSP